MQTLLHKELVVERVTSSFVRRCFCINNGGVLDYTPALNVNLNVDDTGNTFGVINGKYRVYIDPFVHRCATQYYVIGYKGTSPYDGLFYCPYVPLQMVRALVRIHSNQKLSLRLVTEWLRTHSHRVQHKDQEHLLLSNRYYRRVSVTNLM